MYTLKSDCTRLIGLKHVQINDKSKEDEIGLN